MPRVGSNPLKELRRSFVPHEVSVCTIVYIPELAGYWEQAFEVLKVCLASLRQSTKVPFDLVVLDNGSCAEVREFLGELHETGAIQLLILAEQNLGKPGAWNVALPACPGKLIAYTDSDVLFYPGWLERTLEIYRSFESVGMITGRPSRVAPVLRESILGATLRYAAGGDAQVQRGDLIPRAVLDEHLASIGRTQDSGLTVKEYEDVLLTRRGVSAYAYAGHFQFLVARDVALKVLPLAADRALAGDEKEWDKRIDNLQLLKLSLTEPLVRHLGNELAPADLAELRDSYKIAGLLLPKQRTIDGGTTTTGPLARLLRRAARVRRVRRMMQRGYATLFDALR